MPDASAATAPVLLDVRILLLLLLLLLPVEALNDLLPAAEPSPELLLTSAAAVQC
jgi:hypothetical protein